jgi:hypothetical protein
MTIRIEVDPEPDPKKVQAREARAITIAVNKVKGCR